MSFTFTKTSELSNEENSIEIPMDEIDFEQCYQAWCGGQLIQGAFPMLDSNQREFIKTGITPTEWNEAFPAE